MCYHGLEASLGRQDVSRALWASTLWRKRQLESLLAVEGQSEKQARPKKIDGHEA